MGSITLPDFDTGPFKYVYHGPCPDLSLLCVTRASPATIPFVRALVENARMLGAEVCIIADGDDSATLLRVNNIPVAGTVYSKGYIESVLDNCVAMTTRDYVFRIDDDEALPGSALHWLASGLYRDEPHWKFCRAHLTIDNPAQYYAQPPLWPDHQTRLSTRALSLGRTTIHCGSPHGGGALAPVLIEHHKFRIKTREERIEIVNRYNRIERNAGTNFAPFSVPELVMGGEWNVEGLMNAFRQANLMGRADSLSRGIDTAWAIGMHQWRDEIEPFARYLSHRSPQLHNVLEIGTLKGGTAALWHSLCTGKVVSIDLPDGRFGGHDHNYDWAKCEERSKQLIARFPRFHAVLGDSHLYETLQQVEEVLDGERIDLLFIDGDHTYEGVKADFFDYRHLVSGNGVVAFHDILDTDVHRKAGCEVDKLWREIAHDTRYSQEKCFKEFVVNGPWGGIGVLDLGAWRE